jgi:hypothetical protein
MVQDHPLVLEADTGFCDWVGQQADILFFFITFSVSNNDNPKEFQM